MTAQPPSAPETDVRLTEAERDALWEAIDRAFVDTTTWNLEVQDRVDRTVERIVAERVRVVEGERDALAEQWDDSGWLAPAEVEALTARAEAAEAAHAALVAAVEALADEYATAVRDFESKGPATEESRFAHGAIADLRALAGGAR